ncbi:hypothetical protein SLEP1_g16641 [Rubroshorea leprosula]|uniref:Uncharacterized protein n=1 Tax=Rubroshorea leprosula TaxID=152421 RepID=A0AAV5J0Q3_9ROSI|nr:hypothetical protein SLEP1_g16641 [Rubroshorea leprosula]
MVGTQAELILRTIVRKVEKDGDSNDAYGEDRGVPSLCFSKISIAIGATRMNSAKAVCSRGGRMLNIGFGMGLADTAIQQYAPATHTIVEAHLEVYSRMLRTGIFFDTCGEYYEDLRELHHHLPKLLKPGGIYSFFNGLCGDNAFFPVVYYHLVLLELENLGYSTQLIPLPVKDCLREKVWQGVRHKYWQLDTYYLPVC